MDDVHNETQGAGVDPLAAGVVVLKEKSFAAVFCELMNRATPPSFAAGGGPTGHCSWYLRVSGTTDWEWIVFGIGRVPARVAGGDGGPAK